MLHNTRNAISQTLGFCQQPSSYSMHVVPEPSWWSISPHHEQQVQSDLIMITGSIERYQLRLAHDKLGALSSRCKGGTSFRLLEDTPPAASLASNESACHVRLLQRRRSSSEQPTLCFVSLSKGVWSHKLPKCDPKLKARNCGAKSTVSLALLCSVDGVKNRSALGIE